MNPNSYIPNSKAMKLNSRQGDVVPEDVYIQTQIEKERDRESGGWGKNLGGGSEILGETKWGAGGQRFWRS